MWQQVLTSPFPEALTTLGGSNLSSDNVSLDTLSPSIQETATILPNFVPSSAGDFQSGSLQAITDYQEESRISNETEPACGYLILAENQGRLGNQMFVYAAFYGLLRRRPVPENKTVVQRVDTIPSFLGQIFDNLTITPRIIPEAWYTKRNDKVIWITERFSGAYDDRGLDQTHACDGKVVEYNGFRQSYKYFYNWSDEIRREFIFKPEIQQKAEEMLNSVKMNLSRGCVTVGVHLRRGDFIQEDKVQFGYMAATVDYLDRAVQFFQKKILGDDHQLNSTQENLNNKSNCLAFLVFGNDPLWNINASEQARSRLENSNHTRFYVFYPSAYSGAVDMCTMSMCDHAIVSTGTFSWWTGFFNRGIVTYQKEYAVMNSILYNETNPDDLFLPGWIGL